MMDALKIPHITVHGRFQPPLHINHWNYTSHAFRIADKVTILIANPYFGETDVPESPHRNKPENNPFSYEQRVAIFTASYLYFRSQNQEYLWNIDTRNS